MEPVIGVIDRRSPRLLWTNEVGFSLWLGNNLDRLGTAIGLDLELMEREGPVGQYRSDLVAREVGSKRTVIIENQFEVADHDHLGKLLTYSAWKNADIAVWIATRFSEPHRLALEWLNRSSVEKQLFFGVQLEVLTIGGSEMAPNLQVVVRPNGWEKLQAAPATSPKGEKYRAFFTDLVEKLQGAIPGLTKSTRGYPDSWFFFRSGRSSFFYCVEFVQQPARMRVSLYVWSPDQAVNKQYFDLLSQEKDAIEAAAGSELSWERRDDAKTSIIGLYRPASVEDQPDLLVETRDWAIAKLKLIRAAFGPRIEALPRLQPAVSVSQPDLDDSVQSGE